MNKSLAKYRDARKKKKITSGNRLKEKLHEYACNKVVNIIHCTTSIRYALDANMCC